MVRKKKIDIGCPKVRKFKIADLKPADYNPRTIDDENMAGLARAIQQFGCVELIVVNIRGGKNTIIGGHQRHKALMALKVDECLCVTVNCSRPEEKLLNFTLNNPQIQGEFICRAA